MRKIYIAGCGGMLGEAFYNVFKEDHVIKCTDKEVNEDWISFLDFRDFDRYEKDVKEFNPDFLFHLGAYTDLEFCENNPEETYKTNTESVKSAVKIANSLNIPVLYISTAGIFDGNKSLYEDFDVPNPLGIYAKSKYLGEREVIENAGDYLICRAGWMMGGGPRKDKKFIQKIMRQIKDGKEELFVVNDRDGTPTYTYDFANNVKLLVNNNKRGLYNMVCVGETSRFEVAKEILNNLNLEDKIKLTPVSSDYFKKEYFAERPPSERLINKRLNSEGLNVMRDWKVSLKEYLETAYKGYLD